MYAELSPESQVEPRRRDGAAAAPTRAPQGRPPRHRSPSARRAGRSTRTARPSSPCRSRWTPTPSGRSRARFAVPVSDGTIDWRPDLVFPGLEEGEKLDRSTKVPKRAPILAADRSPLAEGPADARTTVGSGGIVTGEIGKPGPDQRAELDARGFPPGRARGHERARARLRVDPRRHSRRASCSPPGRETRGCWRRASRSRASRCGRRSSPSCRTRRPRPSAPRSAAPPSSTPRTATCSRSPGSRSRRPSPRAPPSR